MRRIPEKHRSAFANSNDAGYEYGLTKREYFAARAMQGILSNGDYFKSLCEDNYQLFDSPDNIDYYANLSVAIADKLIEKLHEKEDTNKINSNDERK